MTTFSATSRPPSLFAASNDYLAEAMRGRCDQDRLITTLRDLLSLYFVPDESAEMRVRQIALFVKDMSEFSDDCALWAVDEWRRNHDRRPSPAALRQLAMMRKQEAFKAGERFRKPPEPERFIEPDPVKRAANLERINRDLGMVLHRGQYATPRYVAEAERVERRRPHWTETAAPDDPRWADLRRARAANPLMSPGHGGGAA